MTPRNLLPIALMLPVLGLAACEVPSPAQRKVLDSMIGRSETDLVRSFGVPTRTFATNGHTFLAYVDNETNFSPGTGGPGWGWGWGGWGWGGGGFGGYGGYGGFGGPFGFGGGIPPTYYQSSCATTFEVNAGTVAAWTVRGNGC
jgi:hypothetical protein